MEENNKSRRPILVGVKIDRCWNRHWRCCFMLLTIVLCTLAAVLWRHGLRREQDLMQTDWKNHWSKNQISGVASKQVFEPQGRNVQEKQQTFNDYVQSETNPKPDDIDYYDPDHPDSMKNARGKSIDYIGQYHYDARAGMQKIVKPGEMGPVPEIHDYSHQYGFKDMFRVQLDDEIKFLGNYRNPCWAEKIPRFPYQNNSYLDVSANARILEPQFQIMRRAFNSRQDPTTKWRLRCLPYFYVMQAPPLATPCLYTALGFHPNIINPQLTEPEFWNEKGPDRIANLRDYLDLFDAASDGIRQNFTTLQKSMDEEPVQMHKKITGDGTSSYLWTLNNWKKFPGNIGESEPKVTTPVMVKKLTPKAKIIMLLRNPTERLFQGYLSRTDPVVATATDFHEKAGQAMQTMTDCVKKRTIRACINDAPFNKRLPVRLRIGMYYPFVSDWLNAFSKEQLLVIRYEDYIVSPSQVINDVCKFLEITPFPTMDVEKLETRVKSMESRRASQQKVKMMSMTRAMLKEFYKSFNEELANLLGDDKFNWPELQMDSNAQQDALEQRRAAEQQQNEQQQRDQQQRDQQQRDQQLRDQQQRELQQRAQQQQREQQQREQQQRDQQQSELQQRLLRQRIQQPQQQAIVQQQPVDLQQQKDQQLRDQQQRELQIQQQQRERQKEQQQQMEQQQREQQQRDLLMKMQQQQQQQPQQQQLQQQQQLLQQQQQQQQQQQMQPRPLVRQNMV